MAPITPGDKLNAMRQFGLMKYSFTSAFLKLLGKNNSPLKNHHKK
jgi:hypothetical protein